jgi:glycosyltransferase involved in cell wall biosynthesis
MAAEVVETLVEREGIDLIEAQEYEAPLYYFLLRRALGLGPRREPPCLVHIHSPTEYIARHNEWALDSLWTRTARRMEEVCLASADALLCPSRGFAREAEARYGLREGRIHVIPLPLEDGETLERPPEVWAHGSISYVGRLERRKGVLEWLRAASRLAEIERDLVFEFAGANVLGDDPVTSEVLLREIIPGPLKARFVFWGEREAGFLRELRRRSRIAAVPSRWENFPYACMEACASGLPVIATRRGGLEEMVEHGRTGWLAPNATEADLGEVLRQALETPPGELAEMGRRGSEKIRRLCDDQEVLARHLELRRRVAGISPRNSSRLAGNLPRVEAPPADSGRTRGVAVVLTASQDARPALRSLKALNAQTEPPIHTRVLHERGRATAAGLLRWAGEDPRRRSLEAVSSPAVGPDTLSSPTSSEERPAGWCFLEAGDELLPEALSICGEILSRYPTVGVVTFWRQTSGGEPVGLAAAGLVAPGREAPPASSSIYRAEALVDGLRSEPPSNGRKPSQPLLNPGWPMVVVPMILARERARRSGRPRGFPPGRSWRLAPVLRAVVRHPFVSARALMPIVSRWVRAGRPRSRLPG